MQKDHVGAVYELLNEAAIMIKNELQISYIEALAEAGEMYFLEKTDQLKLPADQKTKQLQALLEKAEFGTYEHEWVRKAFQLAVLKGMKDISHPNRQMTPDTIGLFISYLVNKFMADKKELTILDPALGTGNLLFTVLNQLSEKTANSFGIEIDDVLLKIAYAQANLLKKSLSFSTKTALSRCLSIQLTRSFVICQSAIIRMTKEQKRLSLKLTKAIPSLIICLLNRASSIPNRAATYFL